MTNKNWKAYWSKQQDSRHSVNQDDFFKKIAAEIEYHLGDIQDKTILELGCGDGAILKHLPIKSSQYTGIDFSESLIKLFKSNLPNYKIYRSGAIEFLQETKEKYDIIFSFGVLQYLDMNQLSGLFELQKDHLKDGGIAIHFGVPVKELQSVFLTGQGVQNNTNFIKRPYIKQLKSKFKNNIGYWHELETLFSVSSSTFTTQIIGGMNYLYRVNLRQEV